MWSIVALYAITSSVSLPTMAQMNTSFLPYESEACFRGDHLAACRDAFFNASNFVPAGSSEAFCKIEAAFSSCLEEAVCVCQYPANHTFLENTYKDLMRNDYDFIKYSCQNFNTGYMLKPGISCAQPSQNSSYSYQIDQSTAEQPFIVTMRENCSAVGPCFTKRDRDFEMDLYNKNLSTFCRDYDIFLKCLEMKACECNMQEDQSMLLVDGFEKRLFAEMCSIITGTQTVIPDIACGDTCSLSDPGVTCTQEFEKNIAESKGDEDFCSHLISYTECYDRLVCECSLYQRQSVYMAVSIAKYTFEVRSNCRQFPGMVFPSLQNGFPCTNDTRIPAEEKILNLTTSQDDFVKAEAELCPGVTDCFAKFDVDGSVALYNKDLKAVCQAMYMEIKCLEETTCACDMLQSRFAEVFRAKRGALDSVCGQDVIEVPPPLTCIDQSSCTSPEPLEICSNVLNRQTQQGEDANRVQCENYFNRGQCIKDIGCACGFINNGSSTAAFEVYKLLSSNAAAYDSLGCLSNLNKSESGLECKNKEQVDESDRQLNLTWSVSTDKSELVSKCPCLTACFDQDDVINEEALYAFDYKRVCRNQFNTIKCMEKCFCECKLDQDEVRAAALQEKFIAHNTECSKYAPFGNKRICNEEDICLKAKTTDICLDRLTDTQDRAANCFEYMNYLFCTFDVACTCNLVANGTELSVEMVYRNVTRVVYLMLSHQCSLQNVPVSLFQQGLECFGMLCLQKIGNKQKQAETETVLNAVTALPRRTGTPQVAFAKDPALLQWSSKCPAVITCASQYDEQLTQALIAKDYEKVCLGTVTLIQCSNQALASCGLSSTGEAVSFLALLVNKHEGCDGGNFTETVPQQSSNFGSDALTNTNNSQPQVENESATRGCSMCLPSSQKLMVGLLIISFISKFVH